MIKRSEIIRQGILDLFLSGKIRPRKPISEQLLAEYFDVSRTPIREVVQQLLAEGILRQTSGGAPEFPGLTPKEVRDIYEILEVLLLSSSERLQQLDGLEIDRVKELLLPAADNRDIEGERARQNYLDMYNNLFGLIIRKNDNELIERFMAQMRLRLEQYFRYEWREVFPAREGIRQAITILDALAGRDIDEIKRRIQDHLKWSRDLLLSHMMRY